MVLAVEGSALRNGATISSYSVATLPTAGTLYCNAVAIASVPTSCAANGLRFLPSGSSPNPVTFTYTVTDSNNTSSSSVLFSIPLGVPPTAGAFTNAVNNTEVTAVTIGPMTGTPQSGATIVTDTVTALPANASLYCSSTLISSAPSVCAATSLKILPVASPTGSSTLSYTVTDSNGLTSTAANGVINWNTRPTANAVTNATVTGNAAQPVALSAMSGATTTAGATISTYTVASLPANGTLYCSAVAVSVVPANCAASALTYLPGASVPVSVSFNYTVTDSNGMVSLSAAFTIPMSSAPVAGACLVDVRYAYMYRGKVQPIETAFVRQTKDPFLPTCCGLPACEGLTLKGCVSRAHPEKFELAEDLFVPPFIIYMIFGTIASLAFMISMLFFRETDGVTM